MYLIAQALKLIKRLVGHNNTLSELAAYVTALPIGNAPSSGIVTLYYAQAAEIALQGGASKLLFF